jgi:hypothetical protein
MRRVRRLLTLFAAGIGTGALVSWLRGPDAPAFREPWPADQPWPAIEARDQQA